MMKKFGLLALIVLGIGFLQSCKNKDPSIAKIYVRSSYLTGNQPTAGVKVVLIGDVNSNPETLGWVDTLVTNTSGFVEFNLDSHFEEGQSTFGKEYEVAYFDIIAKTDTSQTTGTIRARIHTTAVETVYMQP